MKKEYIEREALLEKQYDASDLSEFGVTEMVVSVEDIKNAPTADAIEVVRCQNCTEWDDIENECSHWYGMREDCYCSYGIKKAD